jgi:hypothetical protein
MDLGVTERRWIRMATEERLEYASVLRRLMSGLPESELSSSAMADVGDMKTCLYACVGLAYRWKKLV